MSQLKEEFNFFLEHGYTVISASKDKKYSLIVNELFKYYSKKIKNINLLSSTKVAFRDKNENPRHILDLFRDKNAKVNLLIKHRHFKNIFFKFCDISKRYYFTHSKLSFKTKGNDASWSPHQDSGYKKIRQSYSFAIFVCLEDMNEKNGALQLYPDSYKLGRLPHIRIQQSKTGDGQYFIPKEHIPKNYKAISIEANKGDIIIFNQNCIHQSGQTCTTSRRLAFIFELEEYKSFAMDDYGLIPKMALGKIYPLEKTLTFIFSYFSPIRIWMYFSNFPILKKFLRKYILRPLGLQKK